MKTTKKKIRIATTILFLTSFLMFILQQNNTQNWRWYSIFIVLFLSIGIVVGIVDAVLEFKEKNKVTLFQNIVRYLALVFGVFFGIIFLLMNINALKEGVKTVSEFDSCLATYHRVRHGGGYKIYFLAKGSTVVEKVSSVRYSYSRLSPYIDNSLPSGGGDNRGGSCKRGIEIVYVPWINLLVNVSIK